MKRKLLFWGIVLLTVINVAALGTFIYHRFSHGKEHQQETQCGQREFLHRELNLSDMQAAQLKNSRPRHYSRKFSNASLSLAISPLVRGVPKRSQFRSRSNFLT